MRHSQITINELTDLDAQEFKSNPISAESTPFSKYATTAQTSRKPGTVKTKVPKKGKLSTSKSNLFSPGPIRPPKFPTKSKTTASHIIHSPRVFSDRKPSFPISPTHEFSSRRNSRRSSRTGRSKYSVSDALGGHTTMQDLASFQKEINVFIRERDSLQTQNAIKRVGLKNLLAEKKIL
jgi:hypothetical protein